MRFAVKLEIESKISPIQWTTALLFPQGKWFRCIRTFLYCALHITPWTPVKVEFIGTSQCLVYLVWYDTSKSRCVLIIFFSSTNKKGRLYTFNRTATWVIVSFTAPSPFYLTGKSIYENSLALMDLNALAVSSKLDYWGIFRLSKGIVLEVVRLINCDLPLKLMTEILRTEDKTLLYYFTQEKESEKSEAKKSWWRRLGQGCL